MRFNVCVWGGGRGFKPSPPVVTPGAPLGICTCSRFPTEAMHWIKEVEIG